jgi:hypothetical protein
MKEVNEGNQHQHGTEEGVQEELQGRVDPSFPAPHADDQEHRYQHGFPEHVEQHAVERREHADHQAFQDQKGGKVLRRPILDRVPAGNNDERRQKRRQNDQWRGKTIDTHEILDVERVDPWRSFDSVEIGIKKDA